MSYSSTLLAMGPYLYYKLGESSGTVLTDSGSGNNAGALTGSPTLGQPALGRADGTSIRFHGTSGESANGNAQFTATNQFTVTCLVRFNSLRTNSPNGLIQQQVESNLMMRVGDVGHDKQWSVTTNGNSNNGDTSHVATTGTDYHVVFTYDGTTAKLYLNNVFALSFTTTGNILPGTFRFPWDFADGRESDCWMQHVAIFTRVLSSTEIGNLYTAFAPSTGPYRELAGVLNQLAGTNGLEAVGAANAWAGTSGYELVGALNKKAGNSFVNWKPFDAVCNQLASTSGLAGVGALNKLAGNS